VLTSDPRRLEERLEQAQKVWQAAMAWRADEEGRTKVLGSPVTAPAESASEAFTNSIGMEFILIPAGSFIMGEGAEAHQVTLSQPFYLGKYQVTQAQWVAVMGENPSLFKGERHPVDKVSWKTVQAFIQGLEAKEGRDGYYLPSEAEWEYAARAGTTSDYSFGNNHSQLMRYAWFDDNSGGQTHPVGEKKPNPWGLYDMHGNVLEWVYDWYGTYPKSDVTDPCGPSKGDSRVLRGGSYGNSAWGLRSAARYYLTRGNRYGSYGFRLALSLGH
jgi:formylglycine-generating enzyme required for sulfatase activity